jgi:glycosyltransferase involved in cell wall biosynthesis
MGGALRSAKFVKYLPEFGWKTLVMSLKSETLQTSEQNPNIIRLASATPYTRPYHLAPYGWAYNLYQHTKKLHKTKQIHLIYVSCPPFPPAVAALLLKKASHLPLVLDFRDAWTLSPLSNKSRVDGLISQNILPVIEKRVLTGADAFITNTPSMKRAYAQIYPEIQNKIKLIPNGYDETDFPDNIHATGNQDMILLHCGRISVSGRDPALLLHSIKALTAQGFRLKLHLLGEDQTTMQQRVTELGLEKIVTVTGPLSHQEAITQMYRADVLVIYQENSITAQVSAIAGKTYEYLRVGKPVLAIAPRGDNLDIVRKYAPRYEDATDYKESTVIKAINNLYTNWKNGLFSTDFMPRQTYINSYNRRMLTQKLAQIFDSIIKG